MKLCLLNVACKGKVNFSRRGVSFTDYVELVYLLNEVSHFFCRFKAINCRRNFQKVFYAPY